ncbi:MAG: helix-turn-helix domain-containing protein [Bacteroides stercoris]
MLQISQKTAYNLVRQALAAGDMFKVIKIGGVYRIPTEPFLNWLDQMD